MAASRKQSSGGQASHGSSSFSGRVDASESGSHLGSSDKDTELELSKYSRRGASGRYHDKVKRSHLKRNIAITIVVVLVVCLGGIAAYAGLYLHRINDNIHIDDEDDLYDVLTNPTDNYQAGDPFYALLLGIDKSEEREADEEFADTFRTDTIILARIDPGEQQVTLVSIHRDTVVDLSKYGGTGKDKINSAYAYGGRELTVKVISEFAGVPITHYAEIDFDGFEAMVDSLGGVDVNVEMSFYDNYIGGGLEAGEQTLNGEEALIYARARHAFDDYGDGDRYRAKHQREIIESITSKALQTDISTLARTVQTVSEYVQTDLTVSEVVDLARSFSGADLSSCFYSCMEPTESEYDGNGWYEYVVEDEWEEMMAKVDAGLDPGEDDEAQEVDSSGTAGSTSSSASSSSSSAASSQDGSICVLNGSVHDGAASSVGEQLTAEGFSVDTVDNADLSDYQETMVIYKSSEYEDLADDVASSLGISSVYESDDYRFNGDVLVLIGADWDQ